MDKLRIVLVDDHEVVRLGLRSLLERQPDLTTHLTQIAREALSNVVQHAQAGHALLSLRYKGDHLQLVVADDGVGLKECPLNMKDRSSQGMANMRERAKLVGGSCEFVCPTEGGLTVVTTVPCVLEPSVQEGSSG